MATKLGTTLGIAAGAATAWGVIHFGKEADHSYYEMRDSQAAVTCITENGGGDNGPCWEYPDSTAQYQDAANSEKGDAWLDLGLAACILAVGGVASVRLYGLRPGK